MPEVSIPTPRFVVGQKVHVVGYDMDDDVLTVTGVKFDVRRKRLDYTLHDPQEIRECWGGTDGFDEDDLTACEAVLPWTEPVKAELKSLIEQPATRSWQFSDIKTGDVFWLSADRRNTHHCKAQFGHLSADGLSRQFDCLNGAWEGTLTLMDEGAMEMFVHATKSRHFVYVTEKVEHAARVKTEHEVAF